MTICQFDHCVILSHSTSYNGRKSHFFLPKYQFLRTNEIWYRLCVLLIRTRAMAGTGVPTEKGRTIYARGERLGKSSLTFDG